ncbi:hypothetical protein [Mucilaginibacter ginkgonis]|uniref:Uncharacterized protein n=1 Tax=Mucilaginibacter ginkgonis TaxID=2682091 RepID=A0A6I4HUQ8_9SPHI|nr:hypothetical protein [Mucilaginibacter ginkgonis]QQL50163.1 hypothetical protein GO620_001545 [Mucilaginibacter ginkgonis]
MLASISWQHFLTALITLTGGYYFYIALRYYQSELAGFLKGKGKSPSKFPIAVDNSINIIGKARETEMISIADDKDIYYGDTMGDDHNPEVISSAVQEVENDVSVNFANKLEADIENLIEVYKNSDDKEGFLSLINVLVSSFRRYDSVTDLSTILGWTVEHANEKLRFTIALSEVQ